MVACVYTLALPKARMGLVGDVAVFWLVGSRWEKKKKISDLSLLENNIKIFSLLPPHVPIIKTSITKCTAMTKYIVIILDWKATYETKKRFGGEHDQDQRQRGDSAVPHEFLFFLFSDFLWSRHIAFSSRVIFIFFELNVEQTLSSELYL